MHRSNISAEVPHTPQLTPSDCCRPEFVHGFTAPLRVSNSSLAWRPITLGRSELRGVLSSLHELGQLHSKPFMAMLIPVQKLCEEMNIELREYQWPDRWWLDSVRRCSPSCACCEEVSA